MQADQTGEGIDGLWTSGARMDTRRLEQPNQVQLELVSAKKAVDSSQYIQECSKERSI